ncbi:ArsR/SmtB family transcription factor [Kribbella qitaiheensis]|uniref:ArsR/SmtB family transcription factor n=1 Tax=Kribbella qitaiheensis TaxID=1544730 RepID=UPI00361624F0
MSEPAGRSSAARAEGAAVPADGAGGAVVPADGGRALEALGDANRRAIVEILGSGALSVQQIAERLPISRPAVSRHLRLLKEAGLVDDEPDGTRRVYQLRAVGVEAIRDYFAEVWGAAATRFRIVAENTEPRDPHGSGVDPRGSVGGDA